MAVLCESVLLLYWRAETLEVRPLSLPCVVPSPSWPFPSHTSYLTSPLRNTTFGKDPCSSTHEQMPLAFPHSSPCPSCPPLQSLDCSMRTCQLERGTSCLTRPCTQSLQAAVSSGHAAGSRSCWGQRPPESLSRGSPESSLQASNTERAPDVLILWEDNLCERHSVSSLVGV